MSEGATDILSKREGEYYFSLLKVFDRQSGPPRVRLGPGGKNCFVPYSKGGPAENILN